MTPDERRKRTMTRMYAHFARLQTGGTITQMMTRVRMRDDFDDAAWPQLAGGQLDAPEWMPAGSMQDDWQRECRRPR